MFYRRRNQVFCLGIVLLMVLLSWLPQLLTINPGISYGDEGIVAQAARRTINGQWPFRDFYTIFPPGSAWWYGLFLLFFGKTFLALRLGVLITALLIIVSALWIVSRFSPEKLLPGGLILISFLSFFGGPYWFIASHHWLSLLLCLLSLALLLPEPNILLPCRGRVFWAGVAGAGATVTLQHKGGLWLIAASVALTMVPRGHVRSLLSRFWLGVLAVVTPVLGIFLAVVGWRALFDQLVMNPLTRYHLVPGHRGTTIFKDLWVNWQNVSAAWPAADAGFSAWLPYFTWNLGYVGRVLIHVFPFFGVIGLVWLWRTRAQPRLPLVLLTSFFVASYLATLHRFHETTLMFAAPATVLVLVVVVQNFAERGFWKIIITVWTFFFFVTAAGFMLLELLPGKSTIRLPTGTVNTLYPAEAAELIELNAFFQKYRHSGDQVFCITYLPMLYFLLDLENPTPYEVLTPISTKEQFAEVEGILDDKRVRWVVRDHASFGGLWFGKYLMKNYQLRATIGNLTILERTSQSG